MHALLLGYLEPQVSKGVHSSRRQAKLASENALMTLTLSWTLLQGGGSGFLVLGYPEPQAQSTSKLLAGPDTHMIQGVYCGSVHICFAEGPECIYGGCHEICTVGTYDLPTS